VVSDIHRRENHSHEWSKNRHKCRVLGQDQLKNIMSLCKNLWYGIKHDCVIAHFVAAETTIIANIYLIMLRLYFNKLIALKKRGEIFFQQDSVPPHFSHTVQKDQKVRFTNRWIGRSRHNTMVHTESRSLITGIFSCGELLKSQQKSGINIICNRIKTSAAEVIPEKLQQTWHQYEYCPDIHRATSSEYIKIF
jgi:hypothetical protein